MPFLFFMILPVQMVSYKYIDIALTLQVLLLHVSFLPLVIFLSFEFSFLLSKRLYIYDGWGQAITEEHHRKPSKEEEAWLYKKMCFVGSRTTSQDLCTSTLCYHASLLVYSRRWLAAGCNVFSFPSPFLFLFFGKLLSSFQLCELGQSGFVLWSSELILRKCHSFFDPNGAIQWVCRHWRG